MAKLEGFDRIIGMDLSKRTFKACVLTRDKNFEDRKIFSGGMTPEGRGHLLSQIGKKDVVASREEPAPTTSQGSLRLLQGRCSC